MFTLISYYYFRSDRKSTKNIHPNLEITIVAAKRFRDNFENFDLLELVSVVLACSLISFEMSCDIKKHACIVLIPLMYLILC